MYRCLMTPFFCIKNIRYGPGSKQNFVSLRKFLKLSDPQPLPQNFMVTPAVVRRVPLSLRVFQVMQEPQG